MNRQVDQNVVDFVANLITDDAEIFTESTKSPLPAPPPPPARRRPEPKASDVPPPLPPPPKRKRRHPLPMPKYPGSDADKQDKERVTKNEKQKAAERTGRNRSPFGDSLERALDEILG
jgi:hypothetical protein